MKKERIYQVYQVAFFVGIFALWEFAVRVFGIADYLFVGPMAIVGAIAKNYSLLLHHAEITLLEILLGLSLGVSAGIILSVIMVYSKFCKIVLYPLIIGLQALPKIAIVPILLIWLGFGVLPKIVTSALICFFPIVVSFTKGLESLEPNLVDLLIVYQANKRETFFRVRIPNALPDFFAGLKTAIPFGIIGAIFGEFLGANQGLGHLISQAQASLDIALVLAAAIFLSCIGIVLFTMARFIEKKVIFWHVFEEKESVKLTW